MSERPEPTIRPSIWHGYECTFRRRDGGLVTIKGDWFPTADEAAHDAFEQAKSLGYTPPKWWQFWRLGESSLLREAVR